MKPLCAWTPTPDQINATNIGALLRKTGWQDFPSLHAWSVQHLEDFWNDTLAALQIVFRKPPQRLLDTSAGVQKPQWLTGARLNIVDSCLRGAATAPALVTRRQSGLLETVTVQQLADLTNRVANGLSALGLGRDDAVAIAMPMTVEAVALYLAVLKLGAAVVSIPDSFSAEEIAKRLQLGQAQAVFTQAVLARPHKVLPLYEKVCAAAAPQTIVLRMEEAGTLSLRANDRRWEDFLAAATPFEGVECAPHDTINILFSSGTTGIPKAIPWDHTTAIKAAADGYYHQDIHPGDVVCWPTNLGWMMGPWLVFAGLINRACIALYEGSPTERGFCEFVEAAGVTMLGLVPSIVKAWRASNTAEGFDWQRLRCYSSSGEASNPDDYAWLMQLNQNPGVRKPIIEYCGGTEIGGGYVGNNLVTVQYPGEFNGKILGSDFVVLDEDRQVCQPGTVGEAYLLPPALGLSVRLLNNDNDAVYHHGCPSWSGRVLRRHGDRLRVNGLQRYQSDGRVDNTMNLGGIKVGSAELERVLAAIPGVVECAAIGVPPASGGPDRLIVFAVLAPGVAGPDLESELQRAIKTQLNPLFHLYKLIVLDALPRTASQKVMHKDLRALFKASEAEPSA